MKLTILGSGCCIPKKGLSSSSHLLAVDGKNYLIDCGPGSLIQLANAGIDYKAIGTFFISHLHPDHVNDFSAFLLAAQNDPLLKKRAYSVFGPKGFKKFYKQLLKLYPSIAKKNFKVKIRELGNSRFKIGNLAVESRLVKHTQGSLGFRFSHKGKVFAYSGDSGSCPQLVSLAKHTTVFLSECFDLSGSKSSSHLTPLGAGLIAHLAKAKKLVLVHFQPQAKHSWLIQQAREFYKGKIVVGKDFMKIKI